MSEAQQKGQVRMYACGGAGLNIGKMLEPFRGISEVGMAVLQQVYIDTSKSNAKGVNADHSYFFNDMDGSGKVRRENAAEISNRTREILQKFPPLDVSIVLNSASGGSGSVIGPAIVSELLDRELPVIVITIGDTSTRLEIENTSKTLKSYDAISKLRKKPVVMAYYTNSKETPRQVVDKEIMHLVSALMVVFSRENAELDSKDLHNFLNFDATTTFPVQLASLISVSGPFPPDLDGRAISVVAVTNEGEFPSLPFTPDYQANGFLPVEANERITSISPIYLITVSDLPGIANKDLTKRLDVLDQAQRARVSSTKIHDSKDNTTDDGLVL